MEIDFSKLNLQYLVRARDLARFDPDLAAGLLGVSSEIVALLGRATPEQFAAIASIKVPLVIPRGERWWWTRLLDALSEGDPDEIQSVLEHAGLVLAH